ncbi:hypothetical protein BV22DRAFT_1052264 [Leucogyrophana mollusca]|uniref:Uncharacterized protein n=1 Tax=Leucogyrophana mollusca TaxID=85980 RepID=A0ACB8AWL9_9AGAM|nr:hypothetical protein BV22DRAFT_1052264 [Leucogyrophana mollusca]
MLKVVPVPKCRRAYNTTGYTVRTDEEHSGAKHAKFDHTPMTTETESASRSVTCSQADTEDGNVQMKITEGKVVTGGAVAYNTENNRTTNWNSTGRGNPCGSRVGVLAGRGTGHKNVTREVVTPARVPTTFKACSSSLAPQVIQLHPKQPIDILDNLPTPQAFSPCPRRLPGASTLHLDPLQASHSIPSCLTPSPGVPNEREASHLIAKCPSRKGCVPFNLHVSQTKASHWITKHPSQKALQTKVKREVNHSITRHPKQKGGAPVTLRVFHWITKCPN